MGGRPAKPRADPLHLHGAPAAGVRQDPRGARHLNIAHGLYPREPLSAATLDALVAWLRGNVRASGGRTYAGSLTKFEPREIERILVPPAGTTP